MFANHFDTHPLLEKIRKIEELLTTGNKFILPNRFYNADNYVKTIILIEFYYIYVVKYRVICRKRSIV
jgi:hypothetical protein